MFRKPLTSFDNFGKWYWKKKRRAVLSNSHVPELFRRNEKSKGIYKK